MEWGSNVDPAASMKQKPRGMASRLASVFPTAALVARQGGAMAHALAKEYCTARERTVLGVSSQKEVPSRSQHPGSSDAVYRKAL